MCCVTVECNETWKGQHKYMMKQRNEKKIVSMTAKRINGMLYAALLSLSSSLFTEPFMVAVYRTVYRVPCITYSNVFDLFYHSES